MRIRFETVSNSKRDVAIIPISPFRLKSCGFSYGLVCFIRVYPCAFAVFPLRSSFNASGCVQDAWMTGQVTDCWAKLEGRLFADESFHLGGNHRTDFHKEHAAGLEPWRGLLDETCDHLGPGFASSECKFRLVIAQASGDSWSISAFDTYGGLLTM